MVLDRAARFFLPMPASRTEEGGTILKVLVLDAGGRPVADGKLVTLRAAGEEEGSASRTRKGLAGFTSDGSTGMHIVSSGAFSDTLFFAVEEPETVLLTLAVDSRTGDPVRSPVLRLPGGNTIRGDRNGAIRSAAVDTAGAVLYAAGYHPAPVGGIAEGGRVPVTNMDPVFGGALHGRRIVIDPAGGGTVDAGRGPGALRGATVNMRLAKELENLLSAGGARVLVTRKGEEQLSDQQRIFRANRAGAHMAIGLRFGGGSENEPDCFVYNYPGSVSGTAFADTLVSLLSGTPPCESFSRIESSDLFLQQTNCPAVVISGGTLADKDTEAILGSSRWIRIEADAILRSLIAYFNGAE
jgi:N-acetylmuramoyl-L-alanine amidase